METSTDILKILEDDAPRKSGRPKGVVSAHTEKAITAWDSLKIEHPTLNGEALLNLVADEVFGKRLNPQVRKSDRVRLKRTLQRHNRYK
jgi:hypothetical protein